MKFEKIHNKGQARLFRNRHLEYLTKTHPLVIWAIYTPVLVLLPWQAMKTPGFTAGPTTLLFMAGIFFWTLTEYALHRFVFHHEAQSSRTRSFIYLLHGNHHEYPRDRQRLFMPPVPSLILSSGFFLLFWGVMGTYALAFFPGFMLGYLIYGTMHYAIHAWNPPFKWMKGLWRNHHLHHYKHDDKGFGVSSTLWDHVFGTMYDLKNEKEDKEKVRELMFVSTPAEAQTAATAHHSSS